MLEQFLLAGIEAGQVRDEWAGLFKGCEQTAVGGVGQAEDAAHAKEASGALVGHLIALTLNDAVQQGMQVGIILLVDAHTLAIKDKQRSICGYSRVKGAFPLTLLLF